MQKGLEDLKVFNLAYEYVKWVVPTVEKFPKSQKFILASRIIDLSVDIVDLIVNAHYDKISRTELLVKCNLKLERLRILFRLSKDLTYLPFKKWT